MTQRFWILLNALFLFAGRLYLILVGGGSGGTVIAKHQNNSRNLEMLAPGGKQNYHTLPQTIMVK